MNSQYSFSPMDTRPAADGFNTALALDTGSPLVSVAVSVDGEIVAERSTDARHSSSRLLKLIDDCLNRARIGPQALDVLVGVRGPGSFTGLRVGLATLQGMRMALGIQASTVTTFEVLAAVADRESRRVIACVDALRDEWMIQMFESGSSVEPPQQPRLWSEGEVGALRSTCLVGFGVSRLRPWIDPRAEVTLVEPGPLAAHALRLLSSPQKFDWRFDNLSNPLYLSPPTVSRPIPPS